jgi:SAM-dependent methyltransferase
VTLQRIGPAEAAILETFVVPRYLTLFGDLVLNAFLSAEAASVVHLGCRTGYPDEAVAERLQTGTIIGLDPSSPAIELARTKAALIHNVSAEYDVLAGYPTQLPDQSFTHGISLHPSPVIAERRELLLEMRRLILPRGQLVIALPMRGSFQEMIDLLREYALKYDVTAMGAALDRTAVSRPNIEVLTQELMSAGFEDIDVDLRPVSLEFQSGRDFVEDPITRLMLVPELRSSLEMDDLEQPLGYLREAIDRYWSEDRFELTLNIGCASARRG